MWYELLKIDENKIVLFYEPDVVLNDIIEIPKKELKTDEEIQLTN